MPTSCLLGSNVGICGSLSFKVWVLKFLLRDFELPNFRWLTVRSHRLTPHASPRSRDTGKNCNNAHGEREIGTKRPPPELCPPMKRRRDGESVIRGRD